MLPVTNFKQQQNANSEVLKTDQIIWQFFLIEF